MPQALNEAQISEQLDKLSTGWSVENDFLAKSYTFENFKLAVSFIVQIAFEAEQLQHHPNLHNVYNSVTIRLNTHDAGDKITEKDFDLAQRIDRIIS